MMIKNLTTKSSGGSRVVRGGREAVALGFSFAPDNNSRQPFLLVGHFQLFNGRVINLMVDDLFFVCQTFSVIDYTPVFPARSLEPPLKKSILQIAYEKIR